MVKKIFFALINIISVIVIAAAVLVLLIVLLTPSGSPPSIGGYTALRITTGSMAPTYEIDTMLLVKKTDPSEIREGDVISFYSSDPALDGAVNTHRVVSVEEDEGKPVYITKGDGNNTVDSYNVKAEDLIGKVVGSSMLLGKISRLVSNPIIFIPVILVPLAVILISNLVKTLHYSRKIMKEEEEKAVLEAVRQMRENQVAKEKDPE